MKLQLPWPPSVNTYWRRAGHRIYLSERGKQYRTDVMAVVLAESPPRFASARLSMSIIAFPPDRRKRDLDNALKAILDSCCHAGLFDDDEQIDQLTIVRGSIVEDGALEVTLEAIP